MNTREEAVAFLESKGFYAQERDWNMGETILVATLPLQQTDGIIMFRRSLHICRRPTSWVVTRPDNFQDEEVSTLDEACVLALRLLRAP